MDTRLSFRVAALSLVAMTIASCSNEEMPEAAAPQGTVIKAGFEQPANTRTAVKGDGSLVWKSGDAIKLYSYEDTNYNNPITFTTTDDDAANANFSSAETVKGTPYLAAYPAASCGFGTDSELNMNWITTGRITASEASNGPMIAKISDGDYKTLEFKHVAGLLKLTINNLPEEMTALKVTADQKIVGTGKVVYTGENPVLTLSSGNTALTVTNITNANKTLYIPIPVGTYGSIKVEPLDASEKVLSLYEAKEWTNVTVNRAEMLYASFDFPVSTVGDYYTMFNNGENITIAGQTINKSMFEGANVVTLNAAGGETVELTVNTTSSSNTEINQNVKNVIFLSGNGTFSLKNALPCYKDLVIIGRYASQKPTLQNGTGTNFCIQVADGGSAYFYNLTIPVSTTTLVGNASAKSAAAKFIGFDNCYFDDVQAQLFYDNGAQHGVNRIAVYNSKIQCKAAKILFQPNKTLYQDEYKDFEFVNNMVYAYTSSSAYNIQKYQVRLWNSVKADNGNTSESTLAALIKNNTFVHVYTGTNSATISDAFFACQKASALNLSNNLFYWYSNYNTERSALYHFAETCTPTLTLTENYFKNTGYVYYYTTTSLVKEPTPEPEAILSTVAINTTAKGALIGGNWWDAVPDGIFVRGTSMISAGVGSDLDD